MGTILDRIIAEKLKEVEQLKGIAIPNITRSGVSLLSKLEEADEVTIIAEFKRASPSKGDINVGIDVKVQTKQYVDAGADAVSVLTDSSFFKGSFNDLTEVRKTISQPILCKDFIIDPIQIDYAKYAGADLILLIAAALEKTQLQYLYEYAKEKNLEVLMEVHNEEEAEMVLQTGNRLIGVNNRDLKTFHVDLGMTERLAAPIKQSGAFLISESGIKTVEDVKRVVQVGANGILVGETLMKHAELASAIKGFKIPLKEVAES